MPNRVVVTGVGPITPIRHRAPGAVGRNRFATRRDSPGRRSGRSRRDQRADRRARRRLRSIRFPSIRNTCGTWTARHSSPSWQPIWLSQDARPRSASLRRDAFSVSSPEPASAAWRRSPRNFTTLLEKGTPPSQPVLRPPLDAQRDRRRDLDRSRPPWPQLWNRLGLCQRLACCRRRARPHRLRSSGRPRLPAARKPSCLRITVRRIRPAWRALDSERPARESVSPVRRRTGWVRDGARERASSFSNPTIVRSPEERTSMQNLPASA